MYPPQQRQLSPYKAQIRSSLCLLKTNDSLKPQEYNQTPTPRAGLVHLCVSLEALPVFDICCIEWRECDHYLCGYKRYIARERSAVVRASSKILSSQPVLQSRDEKLQKCFPSHLFHPCSQLKSFITHSRVSDHSLHPGKQDCGWMVRNTVWSQYFLCPIPALCLYLSKLLNHLKSIFFSVKQVEQSYLLHRILKGLNVMICIKYKARY